MSGEPVPEEDPPGGAGGLPPAEGPTAAAAPDGDGPEYDEDVNGDRGATTSTRTRHWLTNDSAAWWLLGTFPLWIAADGAGLIDLSAVPETVLQAWLLVVGTAAAWTFGAEAIRALRDS